MPTMRNLMIVLAPAIFLAGCVSKPDGGSKFDPFGAIMKTDKSFNDWVDRRAGFAPEEPPPPMSYQR